MPITDPAIPLQAPRVSFTWSPTSGSVSFVLNGNTYPYSHQADAVSRSTDANYAAVFTPTNQAITFTAIAVVDPTAVAVEYRWDLGDGTIAFGPSVVHIFLTPNKHLSVNCTVKDNYGQTGSAINVLNLIFANVATIRPMLQA